MTTDGYVVIAPEARGPIDIPANSRSNSAMAWGSGTRGAFEATLRGGYFNERRGHGTPPQVNGTVTRWSGANAHRLLAGGDWDSPARPHHYRIPPTCSPPVRPPR